ncbi:hypothetical protein QAD02_016023 [Eretmocerus hayati]|uniref:Uncharacterized protein n=1 Tax=Eretmocerus hayati TaxID=131215 RepID=A0ACC2PB65_9HYME|nr:hypothetical protein QAD02_016023 [Eretmocerus hayati]
MAGRVCEPSTRRSRALRSRNGDIVSVSAHKMAIAMAVGALLLGVGPISAGLCPPRCRCDDESLRSSCAYGGLDIVPIQLNPEIRHLDLSGNRISGLHLTFDFYSNLESLDLSSNLIHALGSNNFRVQQKLLQLNLSSNSIHMLAKAALHGLASLSVLDLSNNNLTDLDEQAFRYTSELEYLDLSGNALTSLPVGLLRNLHRIRSIDLRGNSILEVPSANLALTPSLERLDLSNNLIKWLSKESLPSLPALTYLDLSGNLIRNVSDDAFDRIPGLLSLNLAGNNLTSVPSSAMSKLAVLTNLVLSKNPIEDLKNLAFRNLFELKSLDLSDCAISWVEPRAFTDNVNLERISMDGNRDLTELPARVLYAAGNLRWVSLRRCRLSSLQPTQFPVDGLMVLRVGGNPIVCNCSVHWLWQVLRSNEQSNSIISDPSGAPVAAASMSRLELDSSEIVCADEEFGGKALARLPEGSLRCRLSPIYLGLLVAACLAASLALLGLLAHVARLKRSKRLPAYAPPTRPELLVYVGRANDALHAAAAGATDKHHQHESYSRSRLIARNDELVYDAANLDYQHCRRKSGSESPESRETNVYETPRYSRPSNSCRRENADGQTYESFYTEQPHPTTLPHHPHSHHLHHHQQPQKPTAPPCNGYGSTTTTASSSTGTGGLSRAESHEEGVYAVADVTSLRDEPSANTMLSFCIFVNEMGCECG